MNLRELREVLLDFAQNPCKSWGELPSGVQFMDGTAASLAITQGDRNTARIQSGTFSSAQDEDFRRQLERVESGGGTAVFDPILPELLEFEATCQDCQKKFASSWADALHCYNCSLQRLCPPLPGRQVQHWWYRDDRLWTLQVHGDVGFHNELHYWWYNRISGGNVSHQGLVAYRTPEGVIKKLVLTTVARNAHCRYRFVFDLETDTTLCYKGPNTKVNDDECTRPAQEITPAEPLTLVIDFVVGMVPAFMLYKHLP